MIGLFQKILLIGNGFLGSNIIKNLNQNIEVLSTNLTKQDYSFQLNITKKDEIKHCVDSFNPDLIINCAAIGKIDYLETNPEIAFSVNSLGPRFLAEIANENNIRLVHISTDSIFDGLKGDYSENDLPNPLNVYAKSKYLAEENIRNTLSNYVIIRTNFYGNDLRGNWFLNWILNSLRNGQQITGFTDMHWNPLEINNLASMIIEISNTNFKGILNLSSDDFITKYDFILQVAKIFNFNTKLIIKGTYENDAKIIAQRPKNTTLDNSRSKKLLKTTIISISDSLKNIKMKQSL